jgi:uncharacterized protein (TIGR02611 family)
MEADPPPFCLIWTLMPPATAPSTGTATASAGRHPAFTGAAVKTQALVTRAHGLIDRLEAWAHGGRARSLGCKVFVTVVGPLVVLTGTAMTVLPGPGLVVVALGLALLALEYDWARTALRLMGRALTRARDTALPKDGSGLRRAIGLAGAGAFFVLTFALTAAITTYLGAHAIL